ncbi:MAG: hypothetical protein ACLSAH_00225 [Bilophila wadsworthia]
MPRWEAASSSSRRLRARTSQGRAPPSINAVLMAGTHVEGRKAASCIRVPCSARTTSASPGPLRASENPQVGKVTIGNAVEVGANAAIDRAVLDTTRIGDGTKIDNLTLRSGTMCR